MIRFRFRFKDLITDSFTKRIVMQCLFSMLVSIEKTFTAMNTEEYLMIITYKPVPVNDCVRTKP